MVSQLDCKHLLLAFLLAIILSKLHCHKILVYNPRLSHSHVNFLGRIADILVKAGHDVVTYMPELISNERTNGTKLARIIPGPHFADATDFKDDMKSAWTENDDDFVVIFRKFSKFGELQLKSCSIQLSNDTSMEELRAENFEFGITELFSPCGYAVFHKIGLENYASAFATDLLQVMSDPLGVSSNPSYVPSMYSRAGDKMNYWERMHNLVSYFKMHLMNALMRKAVNHKNVKKYLRNDFDYHEAVRKSSFAFVNSEELLEFPRLVSHKIVFVGGIAVNKPKPLSKEYQKIMNESINGAVLVSFGSLAQSSHMPPNIKNSFYEAFRSFPEVTFIWKYEIDDNCDTDLPNVFKMKWIPQLDLLGHPNLRAFVSHCGQNSLEESINQGVPLICIPLFGDQMHNGRLVIRRNIGIYIEKNDLSPATLIGSLGKILHDNRYLKASKRLLEMIRNKPISPRERLLQHVDFALKFGPLDSFDVASNNLTFIQYYLLDLIIPLLLVLILIVYLIFLLLSRILRMLLPSLSKPKTE